MNNGRLTTLIDGREALPVRAIPYVTGWQFSPDSIAKELARRVGAPFSTLHNLTVYHMPDTTPIPVLPREWDYIVAKLEAHEAELKEQYTNEVIGYAAWRKNSANSLPSGVFVWLDDFEREYMAKREREHFIEPKREGDDELNFTPMLDTETRAMVMEGFGAGQAQIHTEVEEKEMERSEAESIGTFNKTVVRRDAESFETTKRMAEAFPHPKGRTPENWKRTLSDPPAWLRDAREFPGGRGVSALWNPATFALCMVSEGHISKQAALNIIRREFSDFLDEWEDKASHL